MSLSSVFNTHKYFSLKSLYFYIPTQDKLKSVFSARSGPICKLATAADLHLLATCELHLLDAKLLLPERNR